LPTRQARGAVYTAPRVSRRPAQTALISATRKIIAQLIRKRKPFFEIFYFFTINLNRACSHKAAARLSAPSRFAAEKLKFTIDSFLFLCYHSLVDNERKGAGLFLCT
jgi:hypothetical protein